MTFNRVIKTRDAAKMREREMRARGYDDGYAGRPAAVALLAYQQSYRRGMEERTREAAAYGDMVERDAGSGEA